MKTRTEERAYDDGLELVTITQGMNGYPSGLYKAVSGFESFEDAEDFAKEVKGEVVLLTKRDGHQFWTNNGRQYEPLERVDYIDEESYIAFIDEDNFEYWALDELKAKLEMEDNLFDLRSAINEMCSTYNEIANRCGGDITIVDKKDFTCERVREFVTRIHDDDVTTYMLAVVDHETDEDEIEEEDED